MTQHRLFVGLLAGLLAGLVVTPERAEACGGCFSPPETVTTVESHRMVVSLSTAQTTLWDQIRYAGEPEDFVWVLPVPDGAATTVEVADPAFFDEMEAYTQPILQPPFPPGPVGCAPAPNGCGFGAASDAGAGNPGVEVFHEETIGPYETVIVGSEDAGALRAWLTEHGYQVPAETTPTLDHYIGLGSDFVVLRLAPETNVAAMTPVRVRYPGYMATFPLKMVTVGAQGALDLTLWVIADQRFAAANYGTFTIGDDELIWDYATSSSNYRDLFRAKIEAHGGKGWIAEYADLLASLPFSFSTSGELEVARAGLISPFVTRLRTSMLVDHLADDLQLAPSAETGSIFQGRQIYRSVNTPPPLPCPDWSYCAGGGGGDSVSDSDSWFTEHAGCGCTAGSRTPVAGAIAVLLLAVLALRRRRS